ncbi:cob(I)yrinic acid a,c-diamide adenosyltransferase, partial [candidate division KSB1 bacterium]|nr:cob(I)yrinic acid a,c-diamide adenosyltransferase [candidate division KSB1 bacterium]
SSEIAVLQKIKNITVKILGKGFVGILGDKKRHAEHVKAAKKGFAWLLAQIRSKKYNVIIADELITAVLLSDEKTILLNIMPSNFLSKLPSPSSRYVVLAPSSTGV